MIFFGLFISYFFYKNELRKYSEINFFNNRKKELTEIGKYVLSHPDMSIFQKDSLKLNLKNIKISDLECDSGFVAFKFPTWKHNFHGFIYSPKPYKPSIVFNYMVGINYKLDNEWYAVSSR